MGELSDRDLARVLDRAGAGAESDPDRRSQIRAEVLREFDRSVIAAESTDAPPLVLTRVSTSGPITGRGPWAPLAAAAIIGVVVGGLVVVGNRGSDVQPVTDRPPAPPTSVAPRITTAPMGVTLPRFDELAIGDPILIGRYETAIAGGLSFDVPDGVELVAVEPDRLTIGLADRDETVSVVPIENVSRLDAAIERAEADGLLRVERSAGRVGDRSIVRRDLTLTARAIERFSCIAGEPCDVLDTIEPDLSMLALQSGSENFTTLLEVDDSVDIAIVEQFATVGSPTSAIANSIIETIEPAGTG